MYRIHPYGAHTHAGGARKHRAERARRPQLPTTPVQADGRFAALKPAGYQQTGPWRDQPGDLYPQAPWLTTRHGQSLVLRMRAAATSAGSYGRLATRKGSWLRSPCAQPACTVSKHCFRKGSLSSPDI